MRAVRLRFSARRFHAEAGKVEHGLLIARCNTARLRYGVYVGGWVLMTIFLYLTGPRFLSSANQNPRAIAVSPSAALLVAFRAERIFPQPRIHAYTQFRAYCRSYNSRRIVCFIEKTSGVFRAPVRPSLISETRNSSRDRHIEMTRAPDRTARRI